jgi:hypothetical protein
MISPSDPRHLQAHREAFFQGKIWHLHAPDGPSSLHQQEPLGMEMLELVIPLESAPSCDVGFRTLGTENGDTTNLKACQSGAGRVHLNGREPHLPGAIGK